MALTLNNFWGAETGGLEELFSAGSSVTTGVSVGGGDYSYDQSTTTNSTIELKPFADVADAGTGYIFGYRIAGQSPTINFCEGSDTNRFLRIIWSAGSAGFNNLLLYDANDALLVTYTDAIEHANEHLIEIYFQHSASGDVELFVDGTSLGAAQTGKDLTDGGTFDHITILGGTSNGGVFTDNMYMQSGATAATDRLGDCEVLAYRSSLANATPDWAVTGGTLDTGQWADAQEVPFGETNVAAFTASTADAGGVDTNDVGGSAGTGGPNTDANIDGDANIVAMKGIWRVRRTGGSGSVHYGLLGNTGTAIGTGDRTADLNPTTGYINYFDVREDNLPLSTEYGRIGFEKDNKGQDFDCADMLYQILHVPDVAAGTPALIYKPNRHITNFLVR